LRPQDTFGVPAHTVKMHLRRALLELRATIFASIEARTHGAAWNEKGGLAAALRVLDW